MNDLISYLGKLDRVLISNPLSDWLVAVAVALSIVLIVFGVQRLLVRRQRVRGGIAHAFNGSEQQAREFIKLGFKLGFGGTLTYERSLQIRRLAVSLPLVVRA